MIFFFCAVPAGFIAVYCKRRSPVDRVQCVARVGSTKRGLASTGLRSSAIEPRRAPESARPSVLSRLDKRPAPPEETDDEPQPPAKRVAGQGSVFDRLQGASADQPAETLCLCFCGEACFRGKEGDVVVLFARVRKSQNLLIHPRIC